MSSNYKKKSQSKPVTTQLRKKPAFLYTSVCCQEPATKPPCERTQESKEANEFSQSNLGSWSCTRCKRPCAVTRTKTKSEVKEEPNA